MTAAEITPPRLTGTYERVMATFGVLTLGFAVAAPIAETIWALLVPTMAGLVLIWAGPPDDVGYLVRGGRTWRPA